MDQPSFKLNWVEIILGILCFIIALIYGSLITIDLMQNNTASISMSNEQLIVDRKAFLSQTRDLFIAVITLLGGIKIFQKKSFGWSAAVFVTIFFAVLSFAFFAQMIKDGAWGIYLFVSIFASVSSLFLLLYVWLPKTRLKWQVSTGNYILSLIMLGMVGLLMYA